MECVEKKLRKAFIKYLKKNRVYDYYCTYFDISREFRITEDSFEDKERFFLEENPVRWISAAFLWRRAYIEWEEDHSRLWGAVSDEWEEIVYEIANAEKWSQVSPYIRHLFVFEISKNSTVI